MKLLDPTEIIKFNAECETAERHIEQFISTYTETVRRYGAVAARQALYASSRANLDPAGQAAVLAMTIEALICATIVAKAADALTFSDTPDSRSKLVAALDAWKS